MFEIGREVEVSFDEAYCRDTWFPATILEDLGNERFLTEYCRSFTNNESKPLKVTVDSLHIRPCPPLLKDRRFALLEKVDAYFNFGWWSGVITRELEDNKYIVFFQQTRKDKEFDHSLLRPHMEWKDGKWFPSQGVSSHENFCGAPLAGLPNNSEKKSSFVEHNKTNNQFQKLTSSAERPHATRSVVQKRMSLSDLHDAPSQHPKRRKESIVLEGNQKDRHIRSSSKSSSSCVGPGSPDNMISFTKHPTVHPSSDNPSSGKIATRKNGTVGSIGDHGKVKLASCSKKSSEQILQGRSPETRLAEPDAVRSTEYDVQNGNGRKETERPVVIVGLPCPIMENSDVGVSSGESLRSITKELMMKHVDAQMQQQLDCAAIGKSKDSKLLDSTGVIGEKRKRGRPRKTPPKSLQTRISGSARSLDIVGHDLSGQDSNPHITSDMAATENLVDCQNDRINRRKSVALRAVANVDVEKAFSGSIISMQLKNSSTSGRPQSEGGKSVNDSLNACNPTTLNPRMAVNKSVANVLEDNDLDDQPLSTWIQRVQSPVDGSGTSPVSTVEQCTEERLNLDTAAAVPEEDNLSQKNTEKEVSSSVEKGSTAPGEEPSLPSKQSIIWGAIESMDVFQRLPQNPHFAPLKKYKESSREGLAIGYMVTFSTVVERASKLQFSDPKSVTDDILETLEDLEKHGFDVTVVRDRITSLLAVKEKRGKLAKEADILDVQFLEHNSEKSRIEKEILETSEQIRKLQEKLSLAESAKEAEDGEITNLQTRLTEIKETIMNAEQEFNAVASAAF